MIDRFTEAAREAISLAADAAESLGHSYVGTEHLLIGLIQEEEGVAGKVLEASGVRADKVVELVSQLISPNQPVRMAEQGGYSPSARRVLENSYREAVRFKAPLIGTEHILISMIRESDCVAARLLNTLGVSIQKLYLEVLSAMGEDVPAGREELHAGKAVRGKAGTPVLDNFSRDLTAQARDGKLDPVIGRESPAHQEQSLPDRRARSRQDSSGGGAGPAYRVRGGAGDHCGQTGSDPGHVRDGSRLQIPGRV